MRSFVFRLDRVLRYRTYQEKKALVDLSRAISGRLEAKRLVHTLNEQKREMAERCRDEQIRGIRVSRYRFYRASLEKLDHDLKEAYQEVDRADHRVKSLEEALKRESLRKKSLEILKDLHFKRHGEKAEREEQRTLDEMVMPRRGRKG
ncbi:MAG: flagellar export protein FliJ [Deltaproteobacteria bacterium]|nr:flagellar export protein FliJ [Deltaproteobacteria bacterium]